jgi:hypothetical protein
MVPADNSVRFIDQFVEQLDLQELGFNSLATQGRASYCPVHLPRSCAIASRSLYLLNQSRLDGVMLTLSDFIANNRVGGYPVKKLF